MNAELSPAPRRHLCLRYFAVLREQAGLEEEERETVATTPAELYAELLTEKSFTLEQAVLRVAVNGDFVAFDSTLADGDEVVFIPPVAGG